MTVCVIVNDPVRVCVLVRVKDAVLEEVLVKVPDVEGVIV